MNKRCEYYYPRFWDRESYSLERKSYSLKFSDDEWQRSRKVQLLTAERKRKEMFLIIKMNLYQSPSNLISYTQLRSGQHRWPWPGAGCVVCCGRQIPFIARGIARCRLPLASLLLLCLCFCLTSSTTSFLVFFLWRSDMLRVMGRPEGVVCQGCSGDGKALGKDAFNQSQGSRTFFII